MYKKLDFKFNDNVIGNVYQNNRNLSMIEVDIEEGTQVIQIDKQDIVALAKLFNLHVYEKGNKL